MNVWKEWEIPIKISVLMEFPIQILVRGFKLVLVIGDVIFGLQVYLCISKDIRDIDVATVAQAMPAARQGKSNKV